MHVLTAHGTRLLETTQSQQMRRQQISHCYKLLQPAVALWTSGVILAIYLPGKPSGFEYTTEEYIAGNLQSYVAKV